MTYEFNGVDADEEVQRLQRMLENHGLPVEEVKSVGGFRTTGPGYAVAISILNERLRVNVGLTDGTSDEEADELLQPVVDAVGRAET